MTSVQLFLSQKSLHPKLPIHPAGRTRGRARGRYHTPSPPSPPPPPRHRTSTRTPCAVPGPSLTIGESWFLFKSFVTDGGLTQLRRALRGDGWKQFCGVGYFGGAVTFRRLRLQSLAYRMIVFFIFIGNKTMLNNLNRFQKSKSYLESAQGQDFKDLLSEPYPKKRRPSLRPQNSYKDMKSPTGL